MNKFCLSNWIYQKMIKYKFVLVPLISLLIIYILSLVFLLYFTNSHCFNQYLNTNTYMFSLSNIEKLHYASLIILTFILVLVAWVQLSKLHSISQSEFLLKVFNHLSDPTIIKALKILHIMRLKATKKCKDDINNTDKDINKKISLKIKKLRKKEQFAKKFIYLKNFLDYLEHISYLCIQGEISQEDIRKCLDERITTYYNFYEDLILFYQDKNQKHKPYESFAALAGKDNSNNKSK